MNTPQDIVEMVINIVLISSIVGFTIAYLESFFSS
jgi:hypothetical protein